VELNEVELENSLFKFNFKSALLPYQAPSLPDMLTIVAAGRLASLNTLPPRSCGPAPTSLLFQSPRIQPLV
jgi:hypothetical protein